MRCSARYFLTVFTVILLIAVAGCASDPFGKGFKIFRPENPAEALRQLKPLAEQGNADAQFKLGSLYHEGLSVPQDYMEALKWFRRAAEQGYVYAQFNLGMLYAEGGRGIKQDNVQALMWFNFAAAQGDAEAVQEKAALVLRMTPAQIEEAQKRAREFKPESTYEATLRELKPLAEQGQASAQFKLGLMYYKGQSLPQDYTEALKWFRLAARQGDVYGQFNTGFMYEKGQGVPQDYAEAAKWYRQAAGQGNATAQYNLGGMYERGLGVPQDDIQALMWFNLAAAQGNAKASLARDRLSVWMTPAQIVESQRLAREFRSSPK
ncbi:MAG: sel1 repeat family protein [Deltaproteobacteria bacterium]|nr:sel1 repeat family protein [Deltaproteobacteria bacterium]